MHRTPVLAAALAGALAIGPGTAARAAEPVVPPAAADAAPIVLAAGPAAAQALAANAPDHDDPADHAWSESAVAAVTLTGSGATSTSGGVSISGSTVTVTAAGTYRFTGRKSRMWPNLPCSRCSTPLAFGGSG